MTGIVFLYVTHPHEGEAASLGQALVESRLAACVNILPGMRTIYTWEGRVETGHEVVMIVKTRAELAGEITRRIKAAHPYECPCVVTLAVSGGEPAYLDWIWSSTVQKGVDTDHS